MGIIYDTFGTITYGNEAEVNQNFITPLLNNFLGFSLDEIKPEQHFPAFDIQLGRKTYNSEVLDKKMRPDFVVYVNDVSNPKFVVESKSPTEDIDKHAPQSISYATGVKVNIIVITNGIALKIFDVNNLIFQSNDIEELDIKFEELTNILSRDAHINFSVIEVIQSIDTDKTLTNQDKSGEISRKKLQISDFINYLSECSNEFENWQIPREFSSIDYLKIKQYPPDELLTFKDFKSTEFDFGLNQIEIYKLSDIENKVKSQITTIIGPSGVGKTTLLKYLALTKSNECLLNYNIEIPVYIQMRNYGLNHSLVDLIINSFARSGLNISKIQFYDYLQKNSFIFLLDAFDEVQEKYIDELQRELEYFASVRNHRFILTSREIKIPQIPRSSYFYVCPLEISQIEKFIKTYFNDEWYKFFYEIRRKGLLEESKNTLILTLMILIYENDNEVPTSRIKIIENVVNKIKEWEVSKGERFNQKISWKIREEILSDFAYVIAKNYTNLTLPNTEVDKIILPLLDKYVKIRDIPQSITKHDVLSVLTSTGIVNNIDDGVSFWHRAFLEYFASKALAKRYIENPSILDTVRDRLSWQFIIAGTASYLDDSTEFVKSILKINLDLATICLIESKNVDIQLIEKIISELMSNCESPFIEKRSRGIYYLTKMDYNFTEDLLFKIIDCGLYPDVRLAALQKIANDGSIHSKEVVCNLINWKEKIPTIMGFTTQGGVAKALSNFTETEHLMIIDIFKNNPDIFTRNDCKDALLNITRAGKLTKGVENAIFDLFMEQENDSIPSDSGYYLADILIEIDNKNIVIGLIQSLNNDGCDEIFQLNVERILSSYAAEEVIKILIDHAIDKTNHERIRITCTWALSHSNGNIKLSIIESLLDDDNPIIKRNAVEGLNRFSKAEVKDILFRLVNDKDCVVQSHIIALLGKKDLLVELVKKNQFPKKYCARIIKSYLDQIRKYRYYDLLTTIDELDEPFIHDDIFKIDIAHTYCVLGESLKAQKIVESFFDADKFMLSKDALAGIIQLAPHLDNGHSLKIIKAAFNSIDQTDCGGKHYMNKCIEALGIIGTDEALNFLKNLAEKYASDKETLLIEKVFRSLNQIATDIDEDWYINYLKTNTRISNSDLHRAIEGLGRIGTKKSIDLIKEIVINHKNNAYILNVCYISAENISFSNGIIPDVEIDHLINNQFN